MQHLDTKVLLHHAQLHAQLHIRCGCRSRCRRCGGFGGRGRLGRGAHGRLGRGIPAAPAGPWPLPPRPASRPKRQRRPVRPPSYVRAAGPAGAVKNNAKSFCSSVGVLLRFLEIYSLSLGPANARDAQPSPCRLCGRRQMVFIIARRAVRAKQLVGISTHFSHFPRAKGPGQGIHSHSPKQPNRSRGVALAGQAGNSPRQAGRYR